MKVAAILLAAGRSSRFGDEDKLLADLGGRALVSYAAEAIRGLPPAIAIAVAPSRPVARQLEGFTCVQPKGGDVALSASLRAGVMQALAHEPERLLIVLGDMPFVTTDLLQALVKRSADLGSCAFSHQGRALPPACFAPDDFEALLGLKGDQGARALLATLPEAALLEAPAPAWFDVDTKVALQQARMLLS